MTTPRIIFLASGKVVKDETGTRVVVQSRTISGEIYFANGVIPNWVVEAKNGQGVDITFQPTLIPQQSHGDPLFPNTFVLQS